MTTCIVQTPKPRVFETKELSFFKNSMSSSLLPTITIFIGSFLYSDKRWSYSLTHIVPKTRNTSIFHLAHLTLDLNSLHHQQHWICRVTTKTRKETSIVTWVSSIHQQQHQICIFTTQTEKENCFGLEGGLAPNIVVYFQNVLDLFQC